MVTRYPFLTLLFSIFMGSTVAGIVEEAAFRGYVQAPIERRHGPVVAILVQAMPFALLHLVNPGMPFRYVVSIFVFSALVYGPLAYLSGSIVPGAVLHATGDVLSLGILWWLSVFAPLRLRRGAAILPALGDWLFWISCLETIILALLAVWAFRGLALVGRSERT